MCDSDPDRRGIITCMTTTTQPGPARFASAVEAAAYAQKSRHWLFARLRDGSLTRYRSPRDARITWVDLDELDRLIGDIRPAA